MTSNLDLINLLIGFVIPMLVALLAHVRAASWVKAGLSITLAVLGSVLATSVTSGLHWKAFVVAFAIQEVVAIAAHAGILKPAQITGATGLIQRLFSHGIGAGTTDSPVKSGNAAPTS